MPPIEDTSRLRNAPPPHSFVNKAVAAIPHRTPEAPMGSNEAHSDDAASVLIPTAKPADFFLPAAE